jgi:sec-independent protein translocase protein TatB
MIFNIGPLEFILILLVAIIVLGPERMVTGARTFGRWIYKLVRSPTWRAIMSTSQEIRDLPNKIMRESGLEETLKDVQSVGTDLNAEINQAVKDVNDEVSQAAIAVSAEVSQAVKDVNAELKQKNSQEASQIAAAAMSDANWATQAAASQNQPVLPIVPAETVVPTDAVSPASPPEDARAIEAAFPVKEDAPTEVGGYDQALVPIEQPVMMLEDASAVEAAAPSNNGHSQESLPETPAAESAAPEVTQAPKAVKVRKARKTAAPKPAATEEESSIEPPASPASHIKLE